MHVADCLSIAEKVEHQRRRNIVRQVTKYAQRLARFLGQFGEIHRHGVLLVDGQLVFQPRMVLQPGGQISVSSITVMRSMRAPTGSVRAREAGADLDHRFARLRVNGGDNAIDDKLIG